MTTGDSGYIRGGAGPTIDLRRVLQVGLVLAMLGLAIAVVVTTISAADQNSRNARIHHHGVPVVVTVTGCTGYGSGIAQAVNYYQCQGDYTLAGQQYAGVVIGGLRRQVPAGERLDALAVPGDPSSLITVASAARPGSTFAPYVTPVVLAGVIAGLGILLAWSLRSSG